MPPRRTFSICNVAWLACFRWRSKCRAAEYPIASCAHWCWKRRRGSRSTTGRNKYLGGVPQHGEEVARRAGDHKQVPDEVTVPEPVGGEERETTRVSDPTGQDQNDSRQRHQR